MVLAITPKRWTDTSVQFWTLVRTLQVSFIYGDVRGHLWRKYSTQYLYGLFLKEEEGWWVTNNKYKKDNKLPTCSCCNNEDLGLEISSQLKAATPGSVPIHSTKKLGVLCRRYEPSPHHSSLKTCTANCFDPGSAGHKALTRCSGFPA